MSVRLATAQLAVSGEVPTASVLASSSASIQTVMREAHDAGARVVHLPEGALTYPHKRKISSVPGTVAEADWTQVDWAALRSELEAIAALARRLRLWTVVGGIHRLSGGRRPHNSLHVIGDDGALVTRYDKRYLSMTEVTHLFTPGTVPVTFDVDGVRFGCAICIETLVPEVFVEYASLDVDCVLISSAPSRPFGLLAEAHSVMHDGSVSVSFQAGDVASAPSGICSTGAWLARAADDGTPSIAVADVEHRSRAQSWHRRARRDLYDAHVVDDPRSADRTCW